MAGTNSGPSILKIVVAQMCETVGWNSIHTTPLELLTDVLQRYITEVAENTHRYAEQFGHTEPNLHDLGLAFRDMGITTVELGEYVEYVATIPPQREVPKYPVNRESHLNLLRPGSREVVTRPVHIHEHLPAMHPELEDRDYGIKSCALTVDTDITESNSPSPKANPFKRPGDTLSLETTQLKRVGLAVEEEGRPLREISSVMMTTSGFLSPAREGKRPEVPTPAASCDFLSPHSAASYPTVPPEVKSEKKCKKKSLTEVVRKADIETKTQDQNSDPVFEDNDSNVKKLVSMKELSRKRKRYKTKNKKGKFVNFLVSPKIKSELLEHETIEKPKTPAIETVHDTPIHPTPSSVFPFFANFPPAPGLIPPQIPSPFPPRFNMEKHGALVPQHITPQLPPPIPTAPLPSRPEPVAQQLSPVLTPNPLPRPPSPNVISKKQPIPTPELSVASVPVEPQKLETVEKTEHMKEVEKIEHRKDKKVKIKKKKDKKDRIKKKKDKKDKIKNEDNSLEKEEKLRKERARDRKERRRERKREKERKQSAAEKSSHDVINPPPTATVNVSKITLKLVPQSPQANSSEPLRKIVAIKPEKKTGELEKEEKKEKEANRTREPSPELARISALVTTWPVKSKSQSNGSLLAFPITPPQSSSRSSSIFVTPSPSSNLSSYKPRKPPATDSLTIDVRTKEPRKQFEEPDQVQEPLPYYFDNDGNQVWICPACRDQDDGRPMIGCDGCNAWYHWVCVGIQLPPESNDWFCRVCICKKDVVAGGKKKKMRKKKN